MFPYDNIYSANRKEVKELKQEIKDLKQEIANNQKSIITHKAELDAKTDWSAVLTGFTVLIGVIAIAGTVTGVVLTRQDVRDAIENEMKEIRPKLEKAQKEYFDKYILNSRVINEAVTEFLKKETHAEKYPMRTLENKGKKTDESADYEL